TYPEGLSRSAARQLGRLGAQVRTGTRVIGIDEHAVTVEEAGTHGAIPARTVIWAAGVQASSFGRRLAEAAGIETDRSGRIPVGADLSIAGHPEILVIGDLALAPRPRGAVVPGVAPAAIQEGRYAARSIRRRARGEPVTPFHYSDKGDVATIGRLAGVADIRPLRRLGRVSGFPAWMLWLLIHIFYLIGFANRIVVIVRWTWSFFTHGRNTRLITEGQLLPPLEKPDPSA
ncbi:MAG: NAD(P)/FAD-dependent oxidoreductase, partial [Candidatus Limnocylindrales bacterium]